MAALGLITSLAVALPTAADPIPTPAPSGTAQALNLVDAAKAEAKKRGTQIEIPSLHTENMTTVANPDGKTVGTYVYQAPIRYKKGDGTWQTIDTTLVQDGGVIKPRFIKDEVSLSAGGNTDLLNVTTAKGSAPTI